jgi:hypothetical protein
MSKRATNKMFRVTDDVRKAGRLRGTDEGGLRLGELIAGENVRGVELSCYRTLYLSHQDQADALAPSKSR